MLVRRDLSKFDRVSRRIGSAMQSVGEVMAIGVHLSVFDSYYPKQARR